MPAIQMFRNLWSEPPLFKELRHNVRDFVQVFTLDIAAIFAFFNVANRHRNNDTVGNQVAKIQHAFQFRFRRELAILLIIVANVFKDVAVEFFFGTNE